MEIQSLRVRVSEAEANNQLRRVPARVLPAEDLSIGFSSEGVLIRGRYRVLVMPVAFETVWQVQAVGGKVQARLHDVRLAGLPAATFRGALLGMLEEQLNSLPGITLVDRETILFDVAAAAAALGLNVRLHLTSVRTEPGAITLEAGNPQ
jgi:hypothetical protein